MREENKIFSENLCRIMEQRGKTQAMLVADLGVPKSTVSDWCTGRSTPRGAKMDKLCDYLNVAKRDFRREQEQFQSNIFSSEVDDYSLLKISAALHMCPEAKELLDICVELSIDDMDLLLKMARRMAKK